MEADKAMRRRPERKLTRRQEDALFVVGQHEPVTADEVARHLYSTASAERSRLLGLGWRGLVDRQYTGMGTSIGYTLTDAGRQALDALDRDPDDDT